MSRTFFDAYIEAEASAQSFLPRHFTEEEKRVERVRLAAARNVPPKLRQFIAELNGALPSSPARNAHVQMLSQGGVAAVVSGQQVGLFLGPLYTLYKAATAVQLARALSSESGTTCIPVFWLQTEDHDFSEINHCQVYDGTNAPLRLELRSDTASRIAVKQRVIGDEINQLLDTLRDRLDQLEFTDQTLSLLRECYRPGESISQAFARLLASIFSAEGLVLFDPRDPVVSQSVQPVFREALGSYQLIYKSLADRADALRRAGFQEQVPIRENCSLAFFHQGAATGPRFRLERKDSRWMLSGTGDVLTDDQILSVLDSDPYRFSTSALLRPIVQDSILPTAAYVGGPAEVSYFGQLSPLYAHFGIPLPLVVPRARFRLLDARSSATLKRLGLDASQMDRSLQELVGLSSVDSTLKTTSEREHSPEQLRDSLLEPFLERLSAFERESQPLDPAVQKGVIRTRGTVTRAIDRLTRRYAKMTTERNERTVRRVQALQNFLFPESMPQERFYSFVSFACKYGVEHLKKSVLAAVDPFHPQVRDIQL